MAEPQVKAKPRTDFGRHVGLTKSQWYVLSRLLVVLVGLYGAFVFALMRTQPKAAPQAPRPVVIPTRVTGTPSSPIAPGPQNPPPTTVAAIIPAASAPTNELGDFSSYKITAGLSKGRHAQNKVISTGGGGGGSGKMVWPIESTVITSPFGERLDPVKGASFYIHRGVDVRGDCGTPVVAAMDGEVVFADLTKGSGNCVRVKHAGGLLTRYAHLSRADVAVGQQVRAGQKLGVSGATGHTTGPHLHFEIWKNNRPLNPLVFHYRHLPSSVFVREEVGAACNNPMMDEFAVPDSSWGSARETDIQGLLQQYQSQINAQ